MVLPDHAWATQLGNYIKTNPEKATIVPSLLRKILLTSRVTSYKHKSFAACHDGPGAARDQRIYPPPPPPHPRPLACISFLFQPLLGLLSLLEE